MELGCVTLQGSYLFPFTNSRAKTAVLPSIRNSKPIPCFSHKFKCRPFIVNPIRLSRYSPIAAVAGDTTAETTPIHEEPTRDGEEKDGTKSLDDGKMIKVCDKLIEVFMVDKPTPTDWRRLLAFSKEWNNLRSHFFKRCQDRADAEENPGMKHKLLRLGRKLKEGHDMLTGFVLSVSSSCFASSWEVSIAQIDEDVQRHNELLEVIKGAPSEEISQIVSRRRKDFTKEFFMHLHTVAESYYENPTEQNALAKLGNMCLAAVQAYDTATESIEALNAAELKFQDIINSPSIEAACRKIDNLAEKNQLDSALVLMITKAWSAAKESDMTKDEVKDILYHLYLTARGNLQRNMPKEVRILKYLLTIEDPEERLCTLKDAFTPGEEIEGKDVDNLYTTPEKLHTLMRTLVDAYQFSREGTLMREAKDLMNPRIIEKMEELRKLVEKHFM
ncbi:hypothetical protein Patl1_08457 [Pistacia atlantica]|uniref:Uncharacterized protein n=1 Tax=Pistacia atlantica TaxID=434234 RepID=A0ACC1AFH9_9ROSI|nr:hypothetical protein Patl1_08457 [Pistacia atlantica]